MTKRVFTQLFLFLVLALAASPAWAAPAKSLDPKRWEKDIAAFEQSDKTNSPPKDAILFVGSSSIRLWKNVAQDFPEHKVINRGFGGSQICDSTYYADRIVIPYRPKMIVMYAGSNDIANGMSAEQVADEFKAFAEKVRATLPQVKIAFISIAPSPSRWKHVETVKKANQLIADYIAKQKNMVFINVFDAMLGPDGKPKPDIYLKDNLHMNAKGYAIWKGIVGPYLK